MKVFFTSMTALLLSVTAAHGQLPQWIQSFHKYGAASSRADTADMLIHARDAYRFALQEGAPDGEYVFAMPFDVLP